MALGVDTHTHIHTHTYTHTRILWQNESDFKKPGACRPQAGARAWFKKGYTWAFEIQDRMHECIDLVAAEAVYHDSCFSWFMLNKQLDAATAKESRPGQT